MHLPGLSSEATRVPTKVLVIATSLIPSVTIGILRPMLSLERAGSVNWRLAFEGRWTIGDIRWADVVVFCRNQSVDAYTAALVARHEGKKVIFEIDDNFFEMPLNTAMGRRHRDPSSLHTTRRLFELANITRVYNAEMARLAHGFGAEVHHTNVYFDEALVKSVAVQKSEKIRIAFASGRSPDPMLDVALEEALDDVISAHPNDIEIHYWRKPGRLLRNRPQVVQNRGTANYNRFISRFYSAGYDIGLAPLLKTAFYQSKTNSKYREYGGCGIAGIYSRASPYTECVAHEHTGLVVENTRDSWRAALLRLIEDDELRERIKRNARADVLENYSYSIYLSNWRESIDRALASERAQPDVKPLLYHRNLEVGEEISRGCLGKPTDFQVHSIRGEEWSSKTSFLTNVVVGIGASDVLEGPGVVNWAVASNPLDVDHNTLRQFYEAGIRIICDVRASDGATVRELGRRMEAFGDDVGILVCEVAQAQELAGVLAGSTLESVSNQHYARPQRFKTSFGYGIAVPKVNPNLDNVSLCGRRAVWLEVMDTISIFHEMGKPSSPKIPTWIGHLPARYIRYLNPAALSNGLIMRTSEWIHRMRWQYYRGTIGSGVDPQRFSGNPARSHAPNDVE